MNESILNNVFDLSVSKNTDPGVTALAYQCISTRNAFSTEEATLEPDFCNVAEPILHK